jgi:hypothetical protein
LATRHAFKTFITDTADAALVMIAGTITGATAIFTLTIAPPASLLALGGVSATLFATPQQLQGFAADDVFTVQPLPSVETLMGVDGVQSAGFVFVSVRQAIALQADSASNLVFDLWWNAMQTSKDAYVAQGVVSLPTIQSQWNLVNGALTSWHPIPDAKKLLQPRRYEITWQAVQIAPFA